MFNNNLSGFNNSNNDVSIDMSLFTPFSSSTQQSQITSSSETETSSGSSKENFEPKSIGLSPNISRISLNKNDSFNSPSRAVKRKFPGPAGILPDENVTFISQNLSQTTASIFENTPWVEMTKDFQISTLYLYNRFNIAWLKKEASLNRLVNQKSPFLAATIHFIEVTDLRPKKVVNVTLKDLTGEIRGTILYSLYEEHMVNFTIGSVLVLKDFGVLSCKCDSCDNFYITIMPNNLALIYSLKSDNELETVDKIVIVDVKVDDIVKNYTRERQKLDEIANQRQIVVKSVQNLNNSTRNVISNSSNRYLNQRFKCLGSKLGSSSKKFIQNGAVVTKISSDSHSSFKKGLVSFENTSGGQSLGDKKCFSFKKLKTTDTLKNTSFHIHNKNLNSDGSNTNSDSSGKTASESNKIQRLKGDEFLQTINMGSSQISVTVKNKEHANIWKDTLKDIDIDSLFGEF